MTVKQEPKTAGPKWSNSGNICALTDGERHLGHIVRADQGWLAFDGTHVNGDGCSFQTLGFFPSIESARKAVMRAAGLSIRV